MVSAVNNTSLCRVGHLCNLLTLCLGLSLLQDKFVLSLQVVLVSKICYPSLRPREKDWNTLRTCFLFAFFIMKLGQLFDQYCFHHSELLLNKEYHIYFCPAFLPSLLQPYFETATCINVCQQTIKSFLLQFDCTHLKETTIPSQSPQLMLLRIKDGRR